jgi:hypothetical protein
MKYLLPGAVTLRYTAHHPFQFRRNVLAWDVKNSELTVHCGKNSRIIPLKIADAADQKLPAINYSDRKKNQVQITEAAEWKELVTSYPEI